MKAKIILRRDKPAKDGNCPLALCVHFPQRKRLVLGLGGLSCKPGELLPDGSIRGRDQGSRDKTLELQRHLAKANEILVMARLAGTQLDPDVFRAEWTNPGGAQDFIQYCQSEMERQHRLQLIGTKTRNIYATVIRKLQRFAPKGIAFSDVSPNLLEEFDGWHRKVLEKEKRALDGGRSARIKAMKTLRKFFRSALRAGVFEGKNPFDAYKIPKPRESLVFLTREELGRLWALYRAGVQQDVLRAFLFACCTGLRFSDVASLEASHIADGRIRKQVVKGASHTFRLIDVPLVPAAHALIQDGGLPLIKATDQHINRELKRIAALAGIDKRITFHVSRHTFATLFLESGGSVEVLRELLGHGSLQVTMVYVHITGDRRASQIGLFGAMMAEI